MNKLFRRRLAISLLVIVCMSGFSGCKAFIRWWGGMEKEAIVHSGRSQVGNYEWVFDQYHACKAQATKVKFIEDDHEANQIKMVLAGMVEEYNSRSRQSWTRATWKSDIQMPDVDGTYGTNNPGIRFFTAAGAAVEASGFQYIYSDVKLDLNVPEFKFQK